MLLVIVLCKGSGLIFSKNHQQQPLLVIVTYNSKYADHKCMLKPPTRGSTNRLLEVAESLENEAING